MADNGAATLGGGGKDPDLQKYFNKDVVIRMTGNRKVSGILRGFDPHMNVLLHHARELVYEGTPKPMGTTVIRGGAIINLELFVEGEEAQ